MQLRHQSYEINYSVQISGRSNTAMHFTAAVTALAQKKNNVCVILTALLAFKVHMIVSHLTHLDDYCLVISFTEDFSQCSVINNTYI